MFAQKLERKLPLNFTGGLIIDGYSSGIPRYILLIFKEGRILDYTFRLTSYFDEQELPKKAKEWLINKGFDKMQIYSDSLGMVSRGDFERILGMNAVLMLEGHMGFVDKQSAI